MSEVARLQQQIEQAIAAIQRGLTGYAVISRHTCINKRLESQGRQTETLIQRVGARKAMAIMLDALEKGVPQCSDERE